MNRDIKNFNCVFQIEDDGTIGIQFTCDRFLPAIKEYQVSSACVSPFGFRKGQTENLIVLRSEKNIFFD